MEIRKTKKGFRYRGKVYLADGSATTKTFDRKTDARDWEISQRREIERNAALGLDCIKPDTLFETVFTSWFTKKIVNLKSKKPFRTIPRSVENIF